MDQSTMKSIDEIAGNLKPGPDGIWCSELRNEVSYPDDGNALCYQLEDHSFWFKHRNNCIVALVERFPPAAGERIYDIGGGNGFVSQGLMAAGFAAAVVEPGLSGALNARRRGIETVICASTDTAGFKPGVLGAVGLFDVLEHTQDDRDFLASLRELLKCRGMLYLTVPAHGFLWSAEDELAGHFRRYSQKSIRKVLESSGFSVVFNSYMFRALPVPVFLLRALPYRLGCSRAPAGGKDYSREHRIPSTFLNACVEGLFSAEIRRISEAKPMSFGCSCLVAATAS